MITVAISAGGKSSRMGTDKSFVLLHGEPLIAHVIARTGDLGQSETFIIANSPEQYAAFGLPVYPDVLPGKGALGGIYTALHYSNTPYTLLVACDLPFINPALLRYMIGLCNQGDFDIIVPRVSGHPQGLHALYKKTCVPYIRRDLEDDKLKVIGFYRDVAVRYIDEPEYALFDPQGTSFYNINTPQDLQKADDS